MTLEMSVVIRQDLAICTLIICTGKLLVQSHASTTWGLQCWQLAPTRADLTSPKSQVTAQCNCTLTLPYFFHTTVTETSPFPRPWPALERRRKTLGKHGCSLLHKNAEKVNRRGTWGASDWKQWHCYFSAPWELHLWPSPEILRWQDWLVRAGRNNLTFSYCCKGILQKKKKSTCASFPGVLSVVGEHSQKKPIFSLNYKLVFCNIFWMSWMENQTG